MDAERDCSTKYEDRFVAKNAIHKERGKARNDKEVYVDAFGL